MKLWKPALVLAAATISHNTFAATADGTLGDPSDGTVDVTITKQSAAQISGLTAVAFPAASFFSADQSLTDDVCVFSSSGTYGVTVTADSGAFNLVDGAESLAFSMSWDGNALTYNTALSAQTADSSSDPSCGSTTPTQYEVTIASTDFNNAAVGNYAAELTISIAVE